MCFSLEGKTAKGEVKEAWIADYVDGKGIRRAKAFDRRKDADSYHATVKVEVKQGIHTPDSASLTIAEAGEAWIRTAEANNLKRATITNYKQHLRLHIVPHIGRRKLSQLSAPAVRDFEDQLRVAGRSAAMVRKVRTSLSMLLTDAQERGYVNRNVAKELRRSKERKAERRIKGRLKVGIDIPTPAEIRTVLPNLQGRWRPLLLTAIFCGLRASELRGLRWQDIDFDKRELHVRQRADRHNQIGRPKSEAGERTVPIPAPVLNALREWKFASPRSDLGLVFCNRKGKVHTLTSIVDRGLKPAMVAAGLVDENGKAKYSGLHSLRHFYASWCINRKADGGLELPAKVVQERLGHSTIILTMDTYSHLFPRTDDREELSTAAAHLFVV
jgi:integrase